MPRHGGNGKNEHERLGLPVHPEIPFPCSKFTSSR
jgi:hypothetical protein